MHNTLKSLQVSLLFVIAFLYADPSGVTAANNKFETTYTKIITEYLFVKPDSAFALTVELAFNSKINNDTINLIRAHELMGRCKEIKGKYKEAILQYEQGVQLAERIHNEGLIASIYCRLGNTYSKVSDYTKALELHNASLEFNLKLGDSVAVASNCIDIGDIHSQLGQFSEALGVLNEAKSGINTNNYETRIRANNNLSHVYQQLGDFSKAIEFATQNLLLLENNPDHYMLIDVYINMGNIQNEFLNHQEAIKNYMKAEQLAKKYKHVHQTANLALLLGKVYLNIDMLNAAQVHLNEAKENFKQLNDFRGNIEAINGIALIYLKQKELVKAEKLFDYSIELANKHNLPIQKSRSLLGLSKTEFAKQNYQLAESLLYNALEIGNEIEAQLEILKCYEFLHRILHFQGKNKEALEKFEMALDFKNNLFPQTLQKQLNLELSRSEENKRLLHKKEAEKQQALKLSNELERRNQLQYSIILITILVFFLLIFVVSHWEMPKWLIEFMVFLPFLLLFEFLLVVTDPYIDLYTNNDPAWKLAFNTLIAALIFPLHSFFEHKLKQRFVKKQKSN